MGKYLVTWEADMSRFPADLKERAGMVFSLAGMTKQLIEEGKTSDWGIFIQGTAGYSIREGDSLELFQDLQKFSPYINFDVQEVLSVDNVLEAAKAMME